MELTRLIEALSVPAAYPHPAEAIEVRQTHISVVFLAGEFAYKVKKPLDLEFLDYSTSGRRRHFCEEEVRLNRRLAPKVYLGVVPVTGTDGGVLVEGPGEAVEWAVKMVRLPEEATLRARLERDEPGEETFEALARRIASFHRDAEAGPAIAEAARFGMVARNAVENFAQARPDVGRTLSGAVFGRLTTLTDAALAELRPLIEDRAERGVPRDAHGDLRLEHVYLFPDRTPPADLAIVDCIEFDERYRHADPIADAAFLSMDLKSRGRSDLAGTFAEAYIRASGDSEGRALWPFYAAYRAAVRGKVEGLKLDELEIPEAERAEALQRARAHWLVALGELERPGRRPCLVLVGGLPGTGKSTLAHALAERANFRVVRSDEVRKELAGLGVQGQPSPGSFGEGLYSAEWTERTYAECLSRAETLLFEGGRVLVDANFREESRRRAFLDAADRWGVPACFLLCRAASEVVRSRLERRAGDASDADWSVYREAAARWEEPGPRVRRALRAILNEEGPDRPPDEALDALRELNLVES